MIYKAVKLRRRRFSTLLLPRSPSRRTSPLWTKSKSRKVVTPPSRLIPSTCHASGHCEFGDRMFRPERGWRRRPPPKFPNRSAGRVMRQKARRVLGSRRRGGCAGRSRQAKDYLLLGDERASGLISVGILEHRVRARLTHRHRFWSWKKLVKTMLYATVSLELLPSQLSHWRHSDEPNPMVDDRFLDR